MPGSRAPNPPGPAGTAVSRSGSETSRLRRTQALLWVWALVATVCLLLLPRLPALVRVPPSLIEPVDRPPKPPDRLVMVPTDFADLPGFESDSVADALPALRRSCARFRFLGAQRSLRPTEIAGTIGDWLPQCNAILALPRPVTEANRDELSDRLRATLREHSTPLLVRNNRVAEGLFTGYYEPTLQGSRRRTERFRYPLYRNPRDMVSIDLGGFADDLAGRRVSARLAGGKILPYHDREAIESGALNRRGLELVWVDDAVDSFFLHIQGSGRVELTGGGVMRVGYNGQNGYPYYAIGRELVLRAGMEPKDVSMQSIRAWLADNPEQADEVMNTNRSYIFFRELKGEGPLGSQGVALEPGRSLAIDRGYHPMGAPVWLDASAPALDPTDEDAVLQRLFVAQDTGGAIRGPVRGDVFWGPGAEAAEVAGRMKHEGRMWVLYPKALAERVVAAYGE